MLSMLRRRVDESGLRGLMPSLLIVLDIPSVSHILVIQEALVGTSCDFRDRANLFPLDQSSHVRPPRARKARQNNILD